MQAIRFETPSCDVLSPVRNRVGESPLWSVTEQALYWVDIEVRLLYRHGIDGSASCWTADEAMGSVALHAGGGLLAAMESGLFQLKPQAGGLLATSRLCTVTHARPGMRFNDGRKKVGRRCARSTH